MVRRDRSQTGRAASRIGLSLLTLALWLCAAAPAQAQDCSDFGGVLDGALGTVPPSQLQIDQHCTIRNYPASNPLRTNFSFLTQPGQTDQRWIVIFDNVVHTGQMACNAVAGHKIWFVNGSSTSIQQGCQNFLIPVEKIDKQNPPGTTTAAIGVPFTYRLTIPVLFDPATGNVINSAGSVNDLHGITLVDDLNATGVDLAYLGHTATLRSTGQPVGHTFTNVGGVLTFDNFAILPAGEQIDIDVTVVLLDTPNNPPGKQFVNTATWDFGRLIDGEFFEPLPGENGSSPPLTIAAPSMVVSKTGPATLGLTLNLGQFGTFTVDAQNTGLTDAFNLTLLDQLPDGPTGGMCDTTPQILSARVFQSDGSTPVPGKGPLVAGVDYALSYVGVPTCQLRFDVLSAAGTVGPGERLIVSYRTQLDPNTQDGVNLTNVAGATQWFNGDPSQVDRKAFVRTLTNGTVGKADHEDAHTVTAALSGLFFEKSVANLTQGTNPAATARPGDTLRYTLRLQATTVALPNMTFRDDLGAMNPGVVFVPGSLALVPGSLPPGANAVNTDPNGGTNGAGLLDVRGIDVAANSSVQLQFDIVLDPNLADGTLVQNQADLINVIQIADSDDPNVNGQADPNVPGDEDPTVIRIENLPPSALAKANTQATATIGEAFTYRVTVPATPHSAPLYDVRILDDLTASAASLRFLGATRVSGSGSWTPVNTGTATGLVIEDPGGGIDIPAGEQIEIDIRVVLRDQVANVAGLTFTNTATYTYDLVDGNPASQRPGGGATTAPMTIVEPDLVFTKTGPAGMTVGVAGTFTLDAQNVGDSTAWFPTIVDQFPDGATGGLCDATPNVLTAQVFDATGTNPVSPPLVSGTDFSATYIVTPTCQLTVEILTAAGAIAPTDRLIVTFSTTLDVDSLNGVVLTNVAGATDWRSTDGSDPRTVADQRAYPRALTDGTAGVIDHEDAHPIVVALPAYLFEKTVTNLTTGASPATTASPGDVLRYRLRLEALDATPIADLSFRDELDRLNAAPAFQPGTLQLVTVPAGADTTNTSATGGAQGTGVVDVRGLSLGGLGDTQVVEFDVTLAPVLTNGSVVANQSDLAISGATFTVSDDPNVNGPADPLVPGDEDPTRITILSAPVLVIQKTSADLTGDPAVLLAGETLRYTITVRNVGDSDAVDAFLRDAVPVNTQYVPGSTTLNGIAVPDGAGGISPLAVGIAIQDAGATTPGSIAADPGGAGPVATVVFDVTVDPGVLDGTVLSNQAFVSAPLGGVFDRPSDDPATAIPDDPTRDVVGSVPLLFAPKSVALLVDAGSPGIVDPGDVLRYTIAVQNSGAVPATGVTLQDAVPANTTYVADSTTLNGSPVGQPDGGVPPLAAGIPISSADLTPPLPGAGQGTISPGATATVQFDLTVDPGVPAGTLISNQASVASATLPTLLTDGDGNPATGPEPTVVVVGAGQLLTITKNVVVVGGGPALPGVDLEYVVQATNVAAVAAQAVFLTDDLDAVTPGALALVPGSARMNGSTAGVSAVGNVLSADYTGTYGPLAPGASVVLRFRATLAPSLATGTTVTNRADVRWNSPSQTASDSVSIDVGGTPGFGVLNGSLWHDADFDGTRAAGERVLAGWTVELRRNGQLFQSVQTDGAGAYRFGALPPNDTTSDQYAIRFLAPGAGAATASLGQGQSPFTNGPQSISAIVVASGANLLGLDLPIQPNGSVYDALRRTSVSGARLRLVGPGGAPLPASCLDDPQQQDQLTLGDGHYKFDLNFSAAACPSGGVYRIEVAPPGGTFGAGPSQLIPPSSSAGGTPFDVPSCPGGAGDAVPSTPAHCEAQVSELPPPPSVPARSAGTAYHLLLVLEASASPGTSQIFNNHVPIDPALGGLVAITKTTPSLRVSRGELVPYEITVRNGTGIVLPDVAVIDRFPTGLRYVEGSARVDDVAVEPTISADRLTWGGLQVPASGAVVIRLVLAVGAGVGEGDYVNRAQSVSALTGQALSGEATATVRVTPDPTFDCTDVTGKVFDDGNRNGVQDPGEPGLPGVRVVSPRGVAAITDAHGRYHVTCAALSREDRGSNVLLKLDDRTLPVGYRMSTRAVQVKRATRGKALRFNYAASIHRVVALDMADAVFVPGSARMRAHWEPRLGLLLEELRKAPATLRLSYVADVEDESLVEERLAAVEQSLREVWERDGGGYVLEVEPVIFWRHGGPVEGVPAKAASR